MKRRDFAINQIEIGKAKVPCEVALKIIKAGGDKCFKSLTSIFNI